MHLNPNYHLREKTYVHNFHHDISQYCFIGIKIHYLDRTKTSDPQDQSCQFQSWHVVKTIFIKCCGFCLKSILVAFSLITLISLLQIVLSTAIMHSCWCGDELFFNIVILSTYLSNKFSLTFCNYPLPSFLFGRFHNCDYFDTKNGGRCILYMDNFKYLFKKNFLLSIFIEFSKLNTFEA